jgi:hypothetical protein
VERPDDAAEVEAPETFDESTVESVDDIFADGDVAPTAGEPVAEKPAAPDTHRWPGDPDTRADVEPVERPAEPREHQPPDEPEEPEPPGESEPPERPGRPKPLDDTPDREPAAGEPRFVDMSDFTDVVDVGSAVSDKNFEKDGRLRDIGWDRYGEKLKRRNRNARKNRYSLPR